MISIKNYATSDLLAIESDTTDLLGSLETMQHPIWQLNRMLRISWVHHHKNLFRLSDQWTISTCGHLLLFYLHHFCTYAIESPFIQFCLNGSTKEESLITRITSSLQHSFKSREKSSNQWGGTLVQSKVPSTTRQPVKKKRFRPGSKALQEIRHYQRG